MFGRDGGVAGQGASLHRRGVAWLAGAAIAGFSIQPAFADESRSFVVSWFTLAVNSEDGDCPGGTNPVIEEQWHRDLMDAGKTQAEADEIIKAVQAGGRPKPGGINATEEITNRGRIDGKPVNAYANPASVKDPHMISVVAKYGYGFNLDGKGAASPNSFEDPETHEAGVNNELARALGCIHPFRGKPPGRSSNWELWWGLTADSMPAWLITISGADLSKDGDVTVTLDRALEHISKDANSENRADMTYRIDPSPDSHNVLHGKIKNGVVTTADLANVHMTCDTLVIPELVLHRTHLRLTIKPDGKLDGIIGGYQPWNDVFYGVGFGGYTYENALGIDIPGMYHLLRNLADAEPDPKTGLNKAISAAWRIEGVPAFAVPVGAKASKTAQAR